MYWAPNGTGLGSLNAGGVFCKSGAALMTGEKSSLPAVCGCLGPFFGAKRITSGGGLFKAIWGFPKIRELGGPFLVVLIVRALLFWGPY